LRKVEGNEKYDEYDEENESGKKQYNYTFTQFRDDMSARQVFFYMVTYIFLICLSLFS